MNKAVMSGLRGLLLAGICSTGALAGSSTGEGAVNTLPDGREARGILFSHRGGEVVVFEQDFLTETEIAPFAAMGGLVAYYGAIAMAPDEGMLSDANQASANYHSVAAAESAALAACNAARSGGRRCQVVVHFLPRDYQAGRPLTLSLAATNAVRREYRRGRGEKALAISPATGLFAIAKGAGAAHAATMSCNAGENATAKAIERTATDCITVVTD